MNYFEIVHLYENLPVRYFFSDNKKPNQVLPHYHTNIEIIYLLTGHISLTAGTENYQIYPEDIIVLNVNEIHSIIEPNDTTTAYVIQVSIDFISNICNMPLNRLFHIPLYTSHATSQKEKSNIALLQKEIANFFTTSKKTEKYVYIELQSILCKIIYYLFTFFSKEKSIRTENDHKNFENISKLKQYIDFHYTEDIALYDIAEYMGFTPSYFSRYFKNLFGMSFIRYLCSFRLKNAYHDLETTNHSVLYISEKNGFTNYQQFSLKFKEVYGCTPSQCRTKYLENR